MASSTRIGGSYHPIFDKFESQHVTQFLTQSHEAETNTYEMQRTNRWFHLAYTMIFVVVFSGLSWFLLPERADLYLEILAYLGAFVAGGAGGYGFKSWQDQRKN